MKNQTVIKSLVLVGLATVILTTVTVVASGRMLEKLIINFEDDPISITDTEIYEWWDKSGSKISCKITLENRGIPIIRAFALNFMFYDIFNEHLSTINGVSMTGIHSGQSGSVTWEFDPYRASMAYTVIISVRKVRFLDGTIWRQDKHRVGQKIGEVTEMLFKEEQLEEKRE